MENSQKYFLFYLFMDICKVSPLSIRYEMTLVGPWEEFSEDTSVSRTELHFAFVTFFTSIIPANPCSLSQSPFLWSPGNPNSIINSVVRLPPQCCRCTFCLTTIHYFPHNYKLLELPFMPYWWTWPVWQGGLHQSFMVKLKKSFRWLTFNDFNQLLHFNRCVF